MCLLWKRVYLSPLWKSLSRFSLQPYVLYSLWNSPGQNTGVSSLSLLQRIVLLTQGSNPGLPHCRWILTSWATKEAHLSPLPSFKLGCFHIVESKSSLCILVTGSLGFPGGSVVRNPPPIAGDVDLIPGWERCPREGNGNPLQYSCLENPMGRRTWQATIDGVTGESGMT